MELAWGFSVRYPMSSAAQLAPPLPPPSTAIGALAEALAITLGLGETIKVAGKAAKRGRKRSKEGLCSTAYAVFKATKGAAFALSPESPVGVALKSEINRLLQAPYLNPGNVHEGDEINKVRMFGVQAITSAYAPKGLLWMMVVLDEKELVGELRAIRKDLKGEEVMDALERVTIRRIGVKEGIVSTKKKEVGEVTKEEEVESCFYARKGSVVRKLGKAVPIVMWRPGRETFCGGDPKYDVYLVPAGPLSDQFFLTPPRGVKGKCEDSLVIKKAWCLNKYCVEGGET